MFISLLILSGKTHVVLTLNHQSVTAEATVPFSDVGYCGGQIFFLRTLASRLSEISTVFYIYFNSPTIETI
jgi:hypothetical protein